jgi:hypothetical protein
MIRVSKEEGENSAEQDQEGQGDGEGEGEGEEEGEGEAEEDPEPRNKKEFLELASGTSRTRLVHKLYGDRELQRRLSMIVIGLEYLHKPYCQCLDEMQASPEAMREWAAGRAAGAWYVHHVAPLLASIHSDEVTNRLWLTPQSDEPVPVDCEEPWFLDECAAMGQFTDWIVQLGYCEIWQNLPFFITLPGMMQAMGSEKESRRKMSAAWMRRLTEAIMWAEKQCSEDPSKTQASLRRLLQVASFIGNKFARYLMVKGNSENWKHNSDEMRETGKVMCNDSSTTTFIMEKAFGVVTDRGSKHCGHNNRKIDPYSLWFYLSSCGCDKLAGMKQFQTTAAHYQATASIFKEMNVQSNKTAFKTTGLLSCIFIPTLLIR